MKAPLILVKLISFFFYFMANAFAIRFSEMAKPVANASLRQSVIVPSVIMLNVFAERV